MFGTYVLVDRLSDHINIWNVTMSGYMDRRSHCSAPKLYGFQEIKSACVFCLLSFLFLFVGEKVEADHFKEANLPLFKGEDRIKFAQNLA